MYKQLMQDPYCMLASEIDNLTFSQLLLYFTSEEDVKGVREVSKSEFYSMMKEYKTPENRKEFLRKGEEIRAKKLAEMKKKREDRIKAAKGGKRVKK